MNHIRWAAWGVIDIDAMLDRIQRRNYIKRARKELADIGAVLHCGGSTQVPWYRIVLSKEKDKAFVVAGEDAFKKISAWLLQEIGDHERSEDGGVRRAGDEAEASTTVCNSKG